MFSQIVICSIDFLGLDFLHNKVKLVHGDISITNLAIVRDPDERVEPKGPGRQHLMAAVAEQAALDERMPTYGLVLDYDYARPIGTEIDKTSVCLFLICFVIYTYNFHSSGNGAVYAARRTEIFQQKIYS